MADLTLDNSGVLSQPDVNALLNQTKQQLVAQFPYLANNTQFNGDISDAFSKFVNQGVQKGSDYNDIYSKTVAPAVAKWQAKATQDTAKMQEDQELSALQVAKQTGSPTAAVQMFPQLLAPTSKFRAEWVGRINKADEKPQIDNAKYQAKLSLLKSQYAQAPTTSDGDDTRAKIAQQIDDLKPPLLPSPGLQPSAPASVTVPTAQPAPAPLSLGSPVAAPQGTSGYLNPNTAPALQPQGHIYEGAKLSPQAEAAMLAQWKGQQATAAPVAPPAAMTTAAPQLNNPQMLAAIAAAAHPQVNAQAGPSMALPAPAQTPVAAASARVTVKNADGKVGTIPASQLQAALAAGYTEVNNNAND